LKRALIALALATSVSVGCASLIDINELRAPPDAALDGGTADGGGDACAPSGVSNLTVTARAVHTAVDDTDVYFTRDDPPYSKILRCAKCGCDAPTELAANLALPIGLAVDDRYVFWTDGPTNGSLNRFDKKDPTQTAQLPNQEGPVGVALDADNVYWTVIGGGPNGVATAGIYRAKKDNLGASVRLASTPSFPDNAIPYAIAVDDTHVYYTTAPDLDDRFPEAPCRADASGVVYGTVRRVRKDLGLQASEVLARNQPCPLALALGGDAVYWANFGVGVATGSVWTRPKAGGAPVALADGLGRPTSLTFFGDRLSWTAPLSQRVETCSTPACADRAPLASNQGTPAGVTADSSGIYWAVFGTPAASFNDGALRRSSTP
jgi:hypothetical protein